MRKEDLKTGMLVQVRSGYIYMVINGELVRLEGWTSLKSRHLDLTQSMKRDFDIIKVSKVLHGYLLKPNNWTEYTLNANLLWEREEPTEMTIKEIEERLNISNLKIKK